MVSGALLISGGATEASREQPLRSAAFKVPRGHPTSPPEYRRDTRHIDTDIDVHSGPKWDNR